MDVKDEHKIYLHIGLHKTGSTHLQTDVFPLLGLDSVNALVGRRIDHFGLEASGKKLLISEENLSACPYSGSPPSALEKPWIERSCNAIRNLAVMFPQAHVVLGVRRHRGWLLSLYKQYLHQGGLKPFDAFYDIGSRDAGVLKQSDLCFRPRIELLHTLFPNRVFVYDCADLMRNRAAVLGPLCDFLGEEVPDDLWASPPRMANKGVNFHQARLLRMLNHVDRFRRIRRTWTVSRVLCQKILSDWPRRPLELPHDVRKYVDEFYSDDWAYASKSCHKPGGVKEMPVAASAL
ncbi:hypothetical protein [Pontiella sp.]|uniref:hypothetical protein n=1 Tax=Pontiella sp. TaxID=2837462 RepID=UPI00356B1225